MTKMKIGNLRLASLLLLAALLGASAGCGQKGDLYLPDKSEKKS